MLNALLRRPEVLRRSGDGRSTLYLRIDQGLWTRPVALGPRAVAWPESEVEALIAARIAGHDPQQIRELVDRLHARRRALRAG
jgi:prophage regulatory protein